MRTPLVRQKQYQGAQYASQRLILTFFCNSQQSVDTMTAASGRCKAAKNVDPYFYRHSGLVVTIDWTMCIHKKALFSKCCSFDLQRDPLRKMITVSELAMLFYGAHYTSPKIAIVQTSLTVRKTMMVRNIGARKRFICSHRPVENLPCQKLMLQDPSGESAAKKCRCGLPTDKRMELRGY